MAGISLTQELRNEYQHLFETCVIRPERVGQVDAIVNKLAAHKSRYAGVADPVGAPWFLVAVIHSLEGSLSFNGHLHNGDPLTRRTVNNPPGRPPQGNPPFTWEESANDALRLKGVHQWSDWSVPGTLYQLEGYNGFGYRQKHSDVLSPYLWSFSNHYTKGKYTSDRKFDPNAVSQQIGAAVLLKRMAERGIIEWGDGMPSIEEVEKVVSDMYRLLARGEIDGKRSEAHYQVSLTGLREYVKEIEENMYRLLARGEIAGERSEAHYLSSTSYLREILLARESQIASIQQEIEGLKPENGPDVQSGTN